MKRHFEQSEREVTSALPVPLVSLETGQMIHVGKDEAHRNLVLTESLAELRDSELRYRRLFEAAQDGILLLNAQTGQIDDANPCLIKWLGYSHSELLHLFLWEIGSPKNVDACKAAFGQLKAKRYVRYQDLPLKCKTGEEIPVEFVNNVYREGGSNIIQCNIRDITERINAEQTAERRLQSQKMEAIGQLAGGMAHDFNNLLGVILGYCEVLEDGPEVSVGFRTIVGEIRTAGISAKNLTQRLLAFSRRQLLQPILLDLNESVRNMETMLGRLLGDNIEVVSILAADVGTIKVDKNQLELILMNLAINARDAMPDGGRIVIETYNANVDDVYAKQHLALRTGHHVVLTVSDTGCGMDAETKSRAFEPFFSTKEVGQGTGLGLSTVFGIVAQSGGTVSVYSEVGQGATFKVLLPRYDQMLAVLPQGVPSPMPTGWETILLVDDATPLRLLTKSLLEHSGYTVIETGDPAEALRIAGGHQGSLHLMITDIVMPVLNGPGLAQKLFDIRPDTKVLFTSGYTDSSLDRLHLPSTGFDFLGKPFTRAELIGKVREVLDSGSTLDRLDPGD